MLIILEILCVLLLSACSFETHKENHCKLNDNLEYLNTKSLSELKLPKDLDIVLSTSCIDYFIPDLPDTNDTKMGKELNICPPLVFSTDILSESCLMNVKD